jgi:TP901 family phage tail tape measure protein
VKTYAWAISILDKATGPLKGILGMAVKVEGATTKMSNVAQSAFYKLGAAKYAADSFRDFNQAVMDFVQPGIAFQSAMSDVKAITGATQQQLDLMGSSARKTALQFGGEGAAYLNSYKGILSELGPAIAKNPPALASMGQAVAILSKNMGGDAQGAMQALTTGLQQFGGGLTTPQQQAAEMTRQMNIMAAAANEGSAEVPQIAAALKVAGVAASGARVGFIETNAAIQVLAASGVKGAEAGTALRNVLSKLGEGRFMPKDTQKELAAAGVNMATLGNKALPLQARLNELKKIQGDSALVSKMFGLENANAASILLRGSGELGRYAGKITGTNAAVVAARDEMDNFAGRLERMKALYADLGMSAFKTLEPYLPMINGFGQVAGGAARAWPFVSQLGSGIKRVALGSEEGSKGLLGLGGSALKAGAKFLWTATVGIGAFVLGLADAALAQLGLNVAMSANPIGVVVVGLLAVGAAVYGIIKHWDTVKVWLLDLGKFMLKMNPFYWLVQGIFKLFPGVEKWFNELWGKVTGFMKGLLGHIKGLWDKIAPYLGLGEMKLDLNGLSAGLMQPGKMDDPFANPNGPGGAKPGAGLQSGLDKVSSGGSKPTTIIINVAKFQDKIEIHSHNIKEGVNNVVGMLEEALQRVVDGVSQNATAG